MDSPTFLRLGFARVFLASVVALHCGVVFAADAWVLRGFADSPPCPVSGPIAVWTADAILHNTNGTDAIVAVRDVSNDAGPPNHPVLIVPAGGAVRVGPAAEDHRPAPVWLDHLDIPNGVVVEGRLEYRYEDCTAKPQPTEPLGKVSSPVFRELTPAGVATLHPGTDLGTQNVRVNVGIYNAGDVFATALIEVKRPFCPGVAAVTQTVSIPPHWLIQTSVFDPPAYCTFGAADMTTTVTVDQPSLSYAVTLSNAEPLPNVTFGFASK